MPSLLRVQYADLLTLTFVAKLIILNQHKGTGICMVTLNGITWNHTRGFLPVVATAQRFLELHPDISITWQMRSLQQFADAPLAVLAESFDLVVIDHPSIGEAAEADLLVSLTDLLPASFLSEQAAHSVGASHASYQWKGRQYALAIDAATPVAGWRPDLMERAGAACPVTWEDLLALARRGLVTMPAIPIDSLMHLFMLTNSLGSEPFSTPGQVVAPDAGVQALELLRELVQLSAPGSFDRNPIRTWQLLADSNHIAYCPFAYGYSNYSRLGYARNRIEFGGLVSLRGQVLRSTLGGAGLAISKRCSQLQEAAAYAMFTADGEIQRTLYSFSGGQPGHRAAWTDEALNAHSSNFFIQTLSTLDGAWVRPRSPGFTVFQGIAGELVHTYLADGGSPSLVLEQLNAAWLHAHKQAV